MPANRSSSKPNLLFIFADQLGSTYMGCYGHPQVKTPNLDRFAAESVMFEKAYTVCPLCTPFRGALFTGRYPEQTGINRNWQRIDESETSLANLYNEAGYSTIYVGKWHLCDGQTVKTWVPKEDRAGFADFVGWDSGHARHLGQKYFDGDSPEEITMEGHETDALTDIACTRLEKYAGAEKPFCMFVSYQSPHPYCDPPEEYHRLYKDKEIAYRPTVDHDARFGGYGICKNREEQTVKEWTERYFGEITQLDAAVGRLLGKVGELGLGDDTIIVFTSDHGDMGGCHGRFEKNISYEEAARIPCFVKVPGNAPKRVGGLFSSIDFMPTVLGLCGLPSCERAEGIDHSALIRGEEDGARRGEVVMQLKDWSCLLREGERLTMSPDGDEVKMFFRIDDDPYERNNLADDPAQRERIDELSQSYRDWLEGIRSRA